MLQLEKLMNQLSWLDQLIRQGRTGSVSSLADRMEVSASTLHNYLAYMREKGAKIRFSRSRNSYMYEEDGDFVCEIGFKKKS
jgi:predicted DNA-binding transcriptional regulator YafY